MPPAEQHPTALASLRNALDEGTFARGREYARRGTVLSYSYNPDEEALHGQVQGSRPRPYEATVYLRTPEGGGIRFGEGLCTCPVGYDCKHVVAVMVAWLSSAEPETPATPSWERTLASALTEAEPAAPHSVPLGIALSLTGPTNHDSKPGFRLMARLVRPGKKGWVNGNLEWYRLGTSPELNRAHVQILREIFSLHGAAATSLYYYGHQKDIDLTAYASRHLWSLLDEAVHRGVALVHARNGLGPTRRPGSAEFCVDASRTKDTLALAPTLRIAGAAGTPVPVAFVGSPAHGIAYVEVPAGADGAAAPDPTTLPLRLARLSEPVPAALLPLLAHGRSLHIPRADENKFAATYYPRLARAATVLSSDRSYSPPRISPPGLVLHVAYGREHRLTLTWEWRYRIGNTEHRVPLYGTEGAGFRDQKNERTILDALDLPFERHLMRADSQAPLAGQVELHGLDTLRFSTELLPLLRGHDDVTVETEGLAADYREVGDSLRIGLGTRASKDDADWFDLAVTVTVDKQPVSLATVITALSHGESHLLLPDGAYLSLEKPELQTLRKLIDEARTLQDTEPNRLKISRFQAGLWDELTTIGVVDRQAAAWKKQVHGLLNVRSVATTPAPKTLDAELRPYQLHGFQWLAFLWMHQLGGILADDMGLGKTLQSLALICHAREKKPSDAPFLILAPTSVVANWASEAARFAPGLSVAAITRTAAKGGHDLAAIASTADVVVTSHTLFRLDFDAYSALPWSGLILDEAQFAKNRQSRLYQSVRRLEAPFKLAVTGTPLENNLMELWSMLSIGAPGLFPNPQRFKDFYQKPIESGRDAELLAQLRQRIKPLLLRRTKEQVVRELPPKQEQLLEVELSPRHRKIYDTQLARERQKILGLIGDLDKHRFTILRSLTLLRQLSLDAALVDDAHARIGSAKVDALVDQLGDVIAGGHRALVFSQFTGYLDTVRRRFDAEGIEYCYLDGKTRRRADVLNDFKNGDAPVFLISLKAGGFGLNLTEADYCFLLDPWWNPATEAQAVDRTHRIGQTRSVMVYRLIAKDTIEEKVMALKTRKSELFSSVMDDGAGLSSTLTADDIRELLR